MYFQGQKFFVAGISKSGKSASLFLLARKATVYIYDDVVCQSVDDNMKELSNKGAILVNKNTLNDCIEKSDILVLSPGIAIDNELPIAFKQQGKRIIGEAELGSLFLKSTCVAVTGTNGKTTTATMINEGLLTADKKSFLCGNVGIPLCDMVDKLDYDDFAVMEVSSFQLETLSSLRPHIAVITNINDDHLNRHYTMQNYIYLKGRILINLKESDFAVFNADDERVMSLSINTRANKKYFSLEKVVDGAYLQGSQLFYEGEKIMDISMLSLAGKHNIANALTAICTLKILGVSNVDIVTALSTIKGVKHRLESLGYYGGKHYINDSKATNIDSTLNAVRTMESDTVLLVGGKDKGENFENLFKELIESKIVNVVIYGENRFKILDGAIKTNFNKITMCNDLDVALRIANMIAKEGQTILLSPASSSYDAFSNFEERGERFIDAVKSLYK